ncbi:MAG: extracellular solute-binding protein, partial [Lachnospiraceae bacterium]|nr:extracellular solute-binding protein [Lachnospiraceae bacterium]
MSFPGYNGKTYTVPITAGPQGLLYNKDLFKAAGLVDENGEPTPPETFDELVEYAKILTDVGKKQYGIILPLKW